MLFAERLRYAMDIKGMKQVELVKKTGISKDNKYKVYTYF